MNKITLGKTNEQVSVISLGTWSYGKENTSGGNVGWANQSDQDSRLALSKAYSCEINHWDTADVYGEGHSEKIIGSMWTEISRKNIFLATKVGWDIGPHNHWYHPKYMKTKMERSLKHLKTDCVELDILFMGDYSEVNPDVVQPLYNVYDIEYVTSGLKDHVKKNNIGVCYFSPIKHGILTGKYNQVKEFPKGDFRRNVSEFKNIDFINKMKSNKEKIKARFSDMNFDPVLHALLGAILYDNPTACALLGQRNEKQAATAGQLGKRLSKEDALWVLSLYKD